MFFDTLGIKWWYEPEGFSLRFDYEEFAAGWDMDEEELLEVGVPQTFEHLDGKEVSYLPDFYLPELNYWIEIKGPNPTREEVEKAFILSHMTEDAAWKKYDETETEDERQGHFDDLNQQGVFIIYGDIPWPYPDEKGNIFGYGVTEGGSHFIHLLLTARFVAGEVHPPKGVTNYRSLLRGSLNLCWQECPLCLKIAVGERGDPFCRNCYDDLAAHIRNHVAKYPVVSEAGIQDRTNKFMQGMGRVFGEEAPNPKSLKALELTTDLMNPEFFNLGHKSPRLQAAYSAARSARFERGQYP